MEEKEKQIRSENEFSLQKPQATVTMDEREIMTIYIPEKCLTAGPFSWKKHLTSLPPNIRKLSILIEEPSVNTTEVDYYDVDHARKNDTALLPISDLTALLLACAPHLQELECSGVCFTTFGGGENDFDQLQKACVTLRSVRMIHVHFSYSSNKNNNNNNNNNADDSSWMQWSRFTQALGSSTNLNSLHLTTSRALGGGGGGGGGYSRRPALTLDALHAVLSSKSLQEVVLDHFTIWGGSHEEGDRNRFTNACASALRNNTTLQRLALTHCVFCDSRNVVLAGLDRNVSLQHLDLSGSVLHEPEASALADCFSQNCSKSSCLQSISLAHTRFGIDTHSRHHTLLQRTVHSIIHGNHPMLRSMDLRGHDYYSTRSSNSTGGNALVDLVAAALPHNRVLTHVWLDDKHDDNESVEYWLGLNRVQFWQLCSSQPQQYQWIEALGQSSHNLSCVFRILREHPCCLLDE